MCPPPKDTLPRSLEIPPFKNGIKMPFSWKVSPVGSNGVIHLIPQLTNVALPLSTMPLFCALPLRNICLLKTTELYRSAFDLAHVTFPHNLLIEWPGLSQGLPCLYFYFN